MTNSDTLLRPTPLTVGQRLLAGAGTLGSLALAVGAGVIGWTVVDALGADAPDAIAPHATTMFWALIAIVAGSALQLLGWAGVERRHRLGAGPLLATLVVSLVVAGLFVLDPVHRLGVLLGPIVAGAAFVGALALHAWVVQRALDEDWADWHDGGTIGLAQAALRVGGIGLAATLILFVLTLAGHEVALALPSWLHDVAFATGIGGYAVGTLALTVSLGATTVASDSYQTS